MKKMLYKIFIEKTDDVKIQFFRYLFVGGFAAIVNIGTLYIITDILHIYYLISNVLSFILGLTTNYFLSKRLVFGKENNLNKAVEFAIYTLIGIIGLVLDTLFVWLFTNMGFYYMISKLISTCLVFIWNFVGRKSIYIIIDKKYKR